MIECKYTDCLVTNRHLQEKVKSLHLYRLSAYLRNLDTARGRTAAAEGILLYPSTGTPFSQEYVLHGHGLRVLTPDLARSWQEIRINQHRGINQHRRSTPRWGTQRRIDSANLGTAPADVCDSGLSTKFIFSQF
jgi:hypothetical protein